MGWKGVKEGDVLILNRKEVNTANPHYVQVPLNNAAKNSIGLAVLSNKNPDQVNSFENPSAVSPKMQEVKLQHKKLNFELKPYSVNVIRIKKV